MSKRGTIRVTQINLHDGGMCISLWSLEFSYLSLLDIYRSIFKSVLEVF
jgi:hypothetical protein